MNDLRKYLPLIKYANDTMLANANFLVEKQIGILNSSIDLLHDLEGLGECILPSKDLSEKEQNRMYEKYLMYPMLLHIVYPNMYFLPVLILLGALPHTFYSIRTSLEAVTIALYADEKDDLKEMKWLEKLRQDSIKYASFGNIKSSLDKIFNKVIDGNSAKKWCKYLEDLYQQVSSWIHTVARIKLDKGDTIITGLLKATTLKIFEYNVPPSFGLTLPTKYNEVDIENLYYLDEIIGHFRLAVAVMIYVWAYNKDVNNKKCVEEYFNKAYEKYIERYQKYDQ